MAAFLSLALALLAAYHASAGEIGSPNGFGSVKVKKAPIWRDDLPLIRCEVCKVLVKEMITSKAKLTQELKPGKKLEELAVLGRIERLCEPEALAGDWIPHHHLEVNAKSKQLKMRYYSDEGKCVSACRTIAKACEVLSEELDLTDVSAKLIRNASEEELFEWICKEETDACAKPAPAVPADRSRTEAFVPLDPETRRVTTMKRAMEAEGKRVNIMTEESVKEDIAIEKELRGSEEDL